MSSPKHDAVAGLLDSALIDAEDEPAGARTLLSLSAPMTLGKSSLIKGWAQRHHLTWLGTQADRQHPEWSPSPAFDADLVPVVYVTLMARSDARDLYGMILAFLGYPAQGLRRDVTMHATRALATHGVRLLVVDDAHMLNTARVTGRATLDALKQLNTELGELGGTVVLVGANLTGGAALGDPQIRGRLREHELHPYRFDTTDEIRQWQDLLGRAEQRLQAYLPDLATGTLTSQMGGLIYKRTQGYVGDTSALIAGAASTALSAGRGTINRDNLSGVRLSERAHDGERALTQQTPAPTTARRRRAS